jgi:hypothetical protein
MTEGSIAVNTEWTPARKGAAEAPPALSGTELATAIQS